MEGMSLISPFVMLAGCTAGVAIAARTRKPGDSALSGAVRLFFGLLGGFVAGLLIWILWAWLAVGSQPERWMD